MYHVIFIVTLLREEVTKLLSDEEITRLVPFLQETHIQHSLFYGTQQYFSTEYILPQVN